MSEKDRNFAAWNSPESRRERAALRKRLQSLLKTYEKRGDAEFTEVCKLDRLMAEYRSWDGFAALVKEAFLAVAFGGFIAARVAKVASTALYLRAFPGVTGALPLSARLVRYKGLKKAQKLGKALGYLASNTFVLATEAMCERLWSGRKTSWILKEKVGEGLAAVSQIVFYTFVDMVWELTYGHRIDKFKILKGVGHPLTGRPVAKGAGYLTKKTTIKKFKDIAKKSDSGGGGSPAGQDGVLAAWAEPAIRRQIEEIKKFQEEASQAAVARLNAQPLKLGGAMEFAMWSTTFRASIDWRNGILMPSWLIQKGRGRRTWFDQAEFARRIQDFKNAEERHINAIGRLEAHRNICLLLDVGILCAGRDKAPTDAEVRAVTADTLRRWMPYRAPTTGPGARDRAYKTYDRRPHRLGRF